MEKKPEENKQTVGDFFKLLAELARLGSKVEKAVEKINQ